MKRQLISIYCILFTFSLLAQSPDTIQVGDAFEGYKNLEFGTMKELAYAEGDSETKIMALTTKEVKEVTIGGKKYVEFIHSWTSFLDPKYSGNFYYLCEPHSLKPVLHIRDTGFKGREGFAFDGTSIKPLDSVLNNTVTDLDLALAVPTYNWQIDIETFSLLPMKEGYKAVMNLYHPGGPPPGYYLLEVEGSDQVTLADGRSVDCWVLFANYNGRQATRWWYTKQGQNFVKMESEFNQSKFRKVRLY